MYQLKIGTLPLPKLYVCDADEAKKARKLGVPYLIKPNTWDDEKLIKAVLWKTLCNKFPHIKWFSLLHISGSEAKKVRIYVPRKVEVEPLTRENPGYDTCGFSSPDMEVTKDGEYRMTDGGLGEDDVEYKTEWERSSIDKYIGDMGYYVNIEELQALRILPTFLDDIANAIKLNIMNASWCDGYNKKLGCNVGHWQGTDQAPNLIILDVSGSIPSGVAGTMISLIDTLRHQANADLIITSGRSVFYPANSELPDPDKLSHFIGGCNERKQFYAILRKHILGKHWGNVIVFGDQDAPIDKRLDRYESANDPTQPLELLEYQNTRVDRIMAFHTYANKVPGYGLWAKDAAPKAEVIFNHKWVDCMGGGYGW